MAPRNVAIVNAAVHLAYTRRMLAHATQPLCDCVMTDPRHTQADFASPIAVQRLLGRRALLVQSAATVAAAFGARAAGVLPDEVRILVGANLGSPYDRHARIFARHLPRLNPGLRVHVETLPRAGGKLVAKLVHDSGGDGRNVAILPSGLIFAELLGEEGVAYALREMRWIGSFDADLRLLVVSKRLKLDSIEALRQAEAPVLLGAVSTSSASWYEPLILNRVLGTRLKPVPGYTTPSRTTALIAGEIGAAIGTHDSFVELLAQRQVTAVLRLNDLTLPETIPAPPTLDSLVGAGEYRELMALLASHVRFGRAMCLGPRTPPDTAAAWCHAFDAVMRDPTYRQEVAAAGLSLDPLPGTAVESLIARILTAPDATRDALQATLACGMTIADHGRTGC